MTPNTDFSALMTYHFPGVPIIESPLFPLQKAKLKLTADEDRVATSLYELGYAVVDFPDAEIDERIERIKSNLGPRFSNIDFYDRQSDKTKGDRRMQDAWTFDSDVRAIAANEHIIDLLSKLYGRRAFPFQTLNFPVGTQQEAHTDAVHFSSLPHRFMCSVWLAMEDVSPEAGPLFYLPGSHRWPLLDNEIIGRRGHMSSLASAQLPFAAAWSALCEAHALQPVSFHARKGQALIWTANLLHGGSVQLDPSLTRWSQVTHFYFDDCIYYTPAYSDEVLGQLNLRTVRSIIDGSLKPSCYLGEVVQDHSLNWPISKRFSRALKRLMGRNRASL